MPTIASADVRQDDTVLGMTVEQRGLVTGDCPNINATRAYVVSEDGTVYFERNADEQANIASVTKIMTAVVALKYGDLDNTKITISEDAASIGESSAGLLAGDELTLKEALQAMMINSGNDAAQAIAECLGNTVADQLKENGDEECPGGGYDAFIYAMNKTASELGMNNSLFANPHGLDFDEYEADMYSTAHDVFLMAQEAMKNKTFREIVSTDATTITVTRDGADAEIALQSTDILLGNYEGACGIKTGFTDDAGECFAGAFQINGKLLYAIVLNSDSETQRFTDATTLADWVTSNSVTYPLVHSDVTATYDQDGNQVTVPVVAQVAHVGWIDKTFAATLADPNQSVEVFALNGNVSQDVHINEVTSSVHPGDVVGSVDFYQHNEIIATVDLVAAEECVAPNFIEGIGIWWQRLFMDDSQQKSAESVVINSTPLIYGAKATIGN